MAEEMTDFEKVQTVVKYHLGEIAASIEPTPGLVLIVQHKTPGSAFLVSTISDSGDVRQALAEALAGIEDKGRTI